MTIVFVSCDIYCILLSIEAFEADFFLVTNYLVNHYSNTTIICSRNMILIMRKYREGKEENVC